MTNLASIDMGTMTARLLVCQPLDSPDLFKPLFRKRSYIRMADGFYDQEKQNLKEDPVNRALEVISDFASIIKEYNARLAGAVATGIMREAKNRESLSELIHEKTGIRLDVISGEEEARLSALGVARAIKGKSDDLRVFDLGGGTTEFIFRNNFRTFVNSAPIGSLVLKQRFLLSDPPQGSELKALSAYVDQTLVDSFKGFFPSSTRGVIIGTGGTITALAAIIKGIGVQDIDFSVMNGIAISRDELEVLFSRISTMNLKDRSEMTGLDLDRADVIIAGALIVLRILFFNNSKKITLSLSDILEGMLIDYIGRVSNE